MDMARLTDPSHIAELLARYCSFRGWDIDTVKTLDIHPARRTFKDGGTEEVMRHPFWVQGVAIGWQDRCRKPRDKWMGGYQQILPAYNLDALMHSEVGDEVVIVEGVSDCVSLLDTYGTSYPALGLVGASSVRRELTAALQGLRVIVVGDNDDAGQGMVRKLEEHAASFELVQVMVPSKFKDITDWKQSIPDTNEFAEMFELSIIAALEVSNG
jgi:5S rRNA maturation endonuclease (ribonuclease M5)